jgi:flagellar L-ring protein precursor FlgH
MMLRLRELWVALIVLSAVQTAAGQNSSLLQRSQKAATSQPHQTSATPPLTQGYSGWRRRPVAPATKTLHRTSLIAVAPQPPKAFRLHDLVTIIVREQKKFEADAQTDNKKDATFDAALDAWFRIHNHKWRQQGFTGGKPNIKAEFAGELKADGKSEREDKLVTRITAEVIDVKPNGNLVLEANAYIKHDEEEQVLTLTGTCRSIDVTPDNTILSTQLADKRIVSKHTGAVRDATRRGWIPKALDFLRPF